MGKESTKGKFFQKDPNHINGLLDKGCNFEGKLTFDGVVQINGEFQGEILSDGTLVVGSDAHINAKILVDTLIIDGIVQGAVEAKTKVELHRNGTLIANLITGAFVVEEGGIFQGSCQMPSAEVRRSAPTRTTKGDDIFIQESDDQDAMVM